MKRSTLLTLAHKAWQSGEKNPEVAEILVASGLFKSGEIFRITRTRIKVPWEGSITSGRFNPATLDSLKMIALDVELPIMKMNTDELAQLCLDNGTSRSTIERLTGYDTRDSGRERQGDERPSL